MYYLKNVMNILEQNGEGTAYLRWAFHLSPSAETRLEPITRDKVESLGMSVLPNPLSFSTRRASVVHRSSQSTV